MSNNADVMEVTGMVSYLSTFVIKHDAPRLPIDAPAGCKKHDLRRQSAPNSQKYHAGAGLKGPARKSCKQEICS